MKQKASRTPADIMAVAGLVALVLVCSLPLSGASCRPSSCQEATLSLQKGIDRVCLEPAFENTPLCSCCVPSGFYAIDDTCQCTPLILNTDFCFYDDSESGDPKIRTAIQYAASVCQNRNVVVPYGDASTASCRASASGLEDAGQPASPPDAEADDSGP